MRAPVIVALLLVACAKRSTPGDDPFGPPASIALAPASGSVPRASGRLALGPQGVARDGAVLATVAELRDSLHDRSLRDRLASAVGPLPEVLLYVDRSTTYEVLSALISVLGVAGVRTDHVELAVAGPDGKTAAVRLGPPRAAACEIVFRGTVAGASAGKPNVNDVPCVQDPGLAATVRLEAEGFEVTATGANLAAGCDNIGPGLAVRGHDLPALEACLSRIKHLHAEFASERSVLVSAAPSTRFEDLASVLPSAAKDFPDVTLK